MTAQALQAAQHLVRAWTDGRHIDLLPPDCRPAALADGQAVQAHWGGLLGQPVAGWKIAATSLAGQRHIAVDGPLAGPVFGHRVLASGATVSLQHNRMRVAECEVVFHFGDALVPRAQGYTRAEVMAAVRHIGPGIEVPDSRFVHFERAGAAQLTADCACCNDMVLGPRLPMDLRADQLPDLAVQATLSDGRVLTGVGRNVMGDPVEALVWLVNTLSAAGRALEVGQFVTTGACVVPIPVAPGDRVDADFGWLGRMGAAFS